MNTQKTPTGEAQNGQKKELNYNPEDAKKGFKIIGVVVAIIILYNVFKSPEVKPDAKQQVVGQEQKQAQTQEPAPAQEAKEQLQQVAVQEPQVAAPQFAFDVPSLVGKNIDEVKVTLGNPTSFTAPTKQQLAVFDTWDMQYTKDGVNLMITYNPKTKVISDFFIDGGDKNKLLTQGNIQEGNENYAVDFVKNVTNPNEILGVKVSKKLSSELDASVTFNALAFKIENKEDYAWNNCKFSLNGGGKIFSGGYEYKSSSGVKAKGNIIIAFADFTKDSKRFDYYSERPENLFISCDTNGQHRTNYFAIN